MDTLNYYVCGNGIRSCLEKKIQLTKNLYGANREVGGGEVGLVNSKLGMSSRERWDVTPLLRKFLHRMLTLTIA